MKRTLTAVVAVILGLVLLLGVGLFGGGAMLPREHTASASVDIDAPVADVWRAVRDYDRLHQWAPDMVALQRVDHPDGHPAWQMDADGESMRFVIVEESEPHQLVVDLEVASGVFGGRWVYEIEPTELGTRLTITEDGWVGPAPFRVIMTVGGMYDDTVTAHTAALKAHLEG